jgi:hypothetical protein
MGHYKATSRNLKNLSLSIDNITIGELIYPKWYTFNAEIILPEKGKYSLVSTGFWDAKIELRQGDSTFLNFKMGWKGIQINTFFNGESDHYLLQYKGILNSKYVLIDIEENELLTVEFDFQWNKLHYDYNISTTENFDDLKNKELLLLTILHGINYNMNMTTVAAT